MKPPTMNPEVRFLSLFVPDLPGATAYYTSLFQVAPTPPEDVTPIPHPFSAGGPVAFHLGAVQLLLFQCDGRVTHPGDVGIGVVWDGALDEVLQRAREAGGQLLLGPVALPQGKSLAVVMLPDRHFFELLGMPGRIASRSEPPQTPPQPRLG